MLGKLYTTTCPECGGCMLSRGTSSTLVGYESFEEGHDHDDNCRKRLYYCEECDYEMVISKRNRCPHPDCDWVGKDECFCHEGKKVDEWPKPHKGTK